MSRRCWLLLGALVMALSAVLTPPARSAEAVAPQLTVSRLVTGLYLPWDVAFTPAGDMLYTQRGGAISVRLANGTVRQLAADMGDLWISGETGLMAIEVDPGFASNRRVYTCQGTTDNANTVQVVAWVADAGLTRLDRVADPLVGGIDGSTGRHGGCQLRVDQAGHLHVGTGDAAVGTNPQNLQSLAGKTLRVDRFTGAGVAGNATGGDARIYTYGHRNVQGLALSPSGAMFSVEHGTDRDDEVNVLRAGANYGWDPVPGYNETRPMTDLAKFPQAVPAVWSSGFPTIATSAATFLVGSQWGDYEGALAVSALAGRSLRILRIQNNQVTASWTPPELNGTYGRLRAAELGPDGALYITTSNAGNDSILRVAPANRPDGREDVVAVHRPSGQTFVGRSTGAGFAPEPVWLTGWAQGPFTMLLGDTNGDGREDLIAKHDPTGDWYVALSSGRWFTPSNFVWMRSWAWGTGFDVLSGDVTGDGRDDVVAVDRATGSTYVARSTGAGFAPEGYVWLTGWARGDFTMLLADVNGDRRDDLIAKHNPTGDWYVALSSGNRFTPSNFVWMRNWAWGNEFVVLAGDVTGDGRDDVVAVHRPSGQTFVGRSTPSGFGPDPVWLTGWAQGAFTMLLGDTNGDGREDLIAKHDPTGDWYVALSSGRWFTPSNFVWMRSWAWGTEFDVLAGDVAP